MSTFTKSSLLLGLGLLLPLVTGCAAFRPVPGVPARYVPDEFKGETRSGKRTIDLSLLRQSPPNAHRVDTGDLLAIYIEGILNKSSESGRPADPPPVYFPPNNDGPPTIGYPFPVREDGTISLPFVGPLNIRGMTLIEVEQRIRSAYTGYPGQEFLNPGRDRIFVALQRPRTHRVLVIRQESTSDLQVGQQGSLNIGMLKRGTGKVVQLPIYRNDVLNALAETGGLPGLDAENAIYVIRNRGGATGPVPVDGWPTSARENTPVERRVIRAQSPGINPHADYRSGGGFGSGWSAPQPVEPATPQFAPQGNYQSPGGFSNAAVPMQSQHLTPIPEPAGGYAPPRFDGSPYGQPQYSQQAIPQTQAPAWTPPAMPPAPVYVPPPSTSVQAAPMMAAPTNPRQIPYGQIAPAVAPPAWTPAPAGPAQTWPSPLTDGVEIGDSLDGRRIVRIPVRLGPGEFTDITEQDIILEDGDIVFIESRDTEVFYTGGLLGGGQYSLPRDYDLDVLGAIAIAQGAQAGGGGGGSRGTQSIGGQSALNNDVSISASQIIVLRPMPDGTQIPIRIDIYRALRDPSERIVIQPGDYLLLQYTHIEAIGAFIERHLLEGALFTIGATQLTNGGN